jgi:hypothetical protein
MKSTVHTIERDASSVDQKNANDDPVSPSGIPIPSLTRGRSIFNSQASLQSNDLFLESPVSPDTGTIKASSSVSSNLDEEVSSDDEYFHDDRDPFETDVDLVNAFIDRSSAELLAFSNQFWKGDQEWQILAFKLHQTILKLKIDINNHLLTQESRVNAIHNLIAQFNQAIAQRVGNDLDKLKEHNLLTRLLGSNKLSIKSIFLEFKRDEQRLQQMLMKYDEDYIDYQLQPDLFQLKEHIEKLNQENHENPDNLPIEQLISYQSIDTEDPNHNPSRHKKYNALYERLLTNYPQQSVYAACAQEADKLYNEFLLSPPALTGIWQVTVEEMLQLFKLCVPVRVNKSPEYKLSAKINDKLKRASHALNLRPLDVPVNSIPLETRRSGLAHLALSGKPPTVSLKYPLSSTEGLFNEINNHIFTMYDVVRRLAVSPTAPEYLVKHSYPLLRELYFRTSAQEQSYIQLDQKLQSQSMNERSRAEIKQHLEKAKLIAIHEFCFYYKNLDVGPGQHDKKMQQFGDFTQLTETLALRLGAIIDPERKAYNKFLYTREFEVISRVASLQRSKLKEFREQFWLGDEKWQKIARGLEIELDKLLKIVDNKHARLLQRLAAATEIYDVFDRAIQIRVGYEPKALKEHTIVTEALQFMDLGYCFSKISLKDILSEYRDDKIDGKGAVVQTSGMHIIETSLKNIIKRLSPENHRNFVYQRNFRYIYYTLSLYITYLHQYVMLKPRPANELLAVARKLLATVGNRARKIRYVHLPTSDPSLCLNEAKAVLQDFDNGIHQFMQARYDILLAGQLEEANANPVPEVRLTMLAKINEANEELMNGKRKKLLFEELRLLLFSIEQPPLRIDRFLKSLLDKIYSQQRNAKLRAILPKTADANSVVESSQQPGKEFLHMLRVILDSFKPEDTVDDLLERIKPWQKQFFASCGITGNDHLSNLLTELIKNDLKTTLKRFHNRNYASKKLEEAFLRFPATLSTNEFIREIETAVLNCIENESSREQAEVTLKNAMTTYALHDPEGDLIQKFLLKTLNEERNVTEIGGILLDFKRNAEKIIVCWTQQIEEEMASNPDLISGTSLLRQTSDVSSLNSVILPRINGFVLPPPATLSNHSHQPGSGDDVQVEIVQVVQEHKSFNGTRTPQQRGSADAQQVEVVQEYKSYNSVTRSPSQRSGAYSTVVPISQTNGHSQSQQFFAHGPRHASTVVEQKSEKSDSGVRHHSPTITSNGY